MSATAAAAPASSSETQQTPESLAAAAAAAPEAPLTHPLNTEWTLWFDLSQLDKSGDWTNNLHELTTVATAEEWWNLYKHLPRVSELAVGGNLSLFRKGVRPAPRHSANADGGAYQVLGFDPKSFNDIWLYSVLFCIGEVSPDSELICGTVASIAKKKGVTESVTMWISTNELRDFSTVKRLGKLYKESIGLGSRSTRLPFRPHNKALARPSASASASASASTAAAPAAAASAAAAPAADAEPKP